MTFQARTLNLLGLFGFVLAFSSDAWSQQLSPASGATDVCTDTQLRIAFPQPVQLGTGKLRVVHGGTKEDLVVIDATENVQTRTIGLIPNFHYYATLIDGNTVTVTLPSLLPANTPVEIVIEDDYLVTSDDKSIWSGGAIPTWQFKTRSAKRLTSNRIQVAADSSGDFATVQAAIDSIPENNTKSYEISIKNGVYREIICFEFRNQLTIRGEDQAKTIIRYPTNNNFNHDSRPAPGETWPGNRGVGLTRRGMFLASRTKDLTITNLTLHNSTPQGGSQAEALILKGGDDQRTIVHDVNLMSYQDTLQVSGTAYVSDCNIAGDVDFLWGSGPCFLERCAFKMLREKAYVAQVRNDEDQRGFVFKECKFLGEPGVTGNVFARIDPNRYPGSEMVLIDCTVSDAIDPVGWKLDNAAEGPRVRFWEFNSRDEQGKPLQAAGRLPWSRILHAEKDRELIEQYSNPQWVLGGWNPVADIQNRIEPRAKSE